MFPTFFWSLISLALVIQSAVVSDMPNLLEQSGDELDPEIGPQAGSKYSESPRPLYAIAHRVLTSSAAKDALAMGANAVEVDVSTRPKTGWWADHDGTERSAGESVESLFITLAMQRLRFGNIIFVWLDIKNPDACSARQPECGIGELRHLAREILELVGIRVLYGFWSPNSAAYIFLEEELNSMEALNINMEMESALQGFETYGPVGKPQRIMSFGNPELLSQFGDCQGDSGVSGKTCTELIKAARSRNFGQVFGWTSSANQSQYVDLLLDADVDGLIYGFQNSDFYDCAATRSSFKDIKEWVRKHPDQRYMATTVDKPW